MNAKNSFETDFFKLMNNSMFEKNNGKHQKERGCKTCYGPTYVDTKILYEDIVGVHKIKETLSLDWPAYVGIVMMACWPVGLLVDFVLQQAAKGPLLPHLLQVLSSAG